MINFFRKTRKKLANENKFVKYSRYAIGEIVLVVIGILIALQINQNANYNKERKTELTILNEIRTNLNSDLREINEDITYMDSVNFACDFVTHHLKIFDKPNSDFGINALILITTPHFNPNTSGYDLLVSKGVEIIQNDELRKAISDHFVSLYSYYNRYERERIDFRIHFMEPSMTKHFYWVPNPESDFLGEYQITQEEYNLLKSENSFIKLVSAINRTNTVVQNRAYRVEQKIIELSSLIDKELNTKEND